MNLPVNELYDVLFSSRKGLERKIHSSSQHFVTRHYYIVQTLVVQTEKESCCRSWRVPKQTTQQPFAEWDNDPQAHFLPLSLFTCVWVEKSNSHRSSAFDGCLWQQHKIWMGNRPYTLERKWLSCQDLSVSAVSDLSGWARSILHRYRSISHDILRYPRHHGVEIWAHSRFVLVCWSNPSSWLFSMWIIAQPKKN